LGDARPAATATGVRAVAFADEDWAFMEKSPTHLLEGGPSISGFEVLEKLGSGGMGDVFLARQLSLERTVAVKMLHPLSGAAPPASRHQESRLMAALAHPHVVAIHDCGQVDGRDYLVMEHVKGASLRDRMKPGEPWSPAKALPILDATADALAYIHSHEILHLDLKPENVLLDEQGRAKITDFGLAILDRQAHTLEADGVGYGTLDYCSPEQRYGLPVDARSDLFSLAALAYELLTGHVPSRVYRPASTFQRGLTPAVDDVLRRGLERNPDDRQKSVAEFRQELTKALRPPRSKRQFVVVAALILAMAITSATVFQAISGYSWFTTPAQKAPSSWDGQSCLIYERPEELTWLGPLEGETAALMGQPIGVRGVRPNPDLGLPIPAWPSPGPVLLLSKGEEMAFVHLNDLSPSQALALTRSWTSLRDLPALASEDNFVVGGFPNDKRMLSENDVWRAIRWPEWSEDHAVFFDNPQDGPGRSALCFVRQVNRPVLPDVSVYQWLSRVPNREGTLMVMRYRARAEEGNGRLSMGVHLPLHIPKNEPGDVAARLRKIATPQSSIQEGGADVDVLEIAFDDWVQPGPEWRSYYVIFNWPSFCKTGEFRNLTLTYAGEGKAWVDQIEVFPWRVPAGP
jgi:hypothetical protein